MELHLKPEIKGEIFNQVARVMGIDGQDAFRGEHEKVDTIEVVFVDEHDHEHPVTALKDAEINGPNVGMDSIVRIIESAVMRDALTRWGNVVYALYFHLKGGQANRERFPFIVEGSAHRYRGGGGPGGPNGYGALTVRGRDAFGGVGGSTEMMTMQEALRIVPELLKWSTEERRVNDERVDVAFKSMQQTIAMQNEIIQSGNEREMRIRELENQLMERKYEIDKKRKKDEESEKRTATLWKIAEQYGVPLGAMILPPIIEGIRKLNAGPNYVPSEVNFEKVQEIIKNAQAAAEGEPVHVTPPKPPGANGAAPSSAQGAPQGPPGPPAPPGAPDEHPLQAFHKRIAFDLVRLMSLVRAKGHVDTIKAALEDETALLKLYEEIVKATESAGTSDEDIDKLAQLALGFGSALMQKQEIGMKLFMSVDGFEQQALRDFMGLLQHYGSFVQHMMAQQKEPQAEEPI